MFCVFSFNYLYICSFQYYLMYYVYICVLCIYVYLFLKCFVLHYHSTKHFVLCFIFHFYLCKAHLIAFVYEMCYINTLALSCLHWLSVLVEVIQRWCRHTSLMSIFDVNQVWHFGKRWVSAHHVTHTEAWSGMTTWPSLPQTPLSQGLGIEIPLYNVLCTILCPLFTIR